MTATDRIRAAIQRCIEANHEPSDGSDIAAAVLQEAAEVLFPEKPEPIEPIPMTTIRAINHAEHWSAWCALKAAKERLRALAQELNGTDYGNHIPDARKMVSPAEGEEPEVVALARPTDAQLIEEAIAVGLAFQPQDEVSEVFLPFDAEEPLDELLVNFARAVLARWGHQPAPPAEGEAIGPEWQPCVKLPITVHVREQWPGETQVSTREGITPVRPDDLIMRGVQGEEYPIGRELFNKTYRLGTAGHQPAPSAEGEVAELALKELEQTVVLLMPVTGHKKIKRFDTIRAALKRLQELENNADLSPAPAPAEGEVAELVAWLRDHAYVLNPSAKRKARRICDLLERQAAPVPVLPEDAKVIKPTKHTILVPAPVPVAVSERLPGPEDCDAEHYCWRWNTIGVLWARQPLARSWYEFESHWLPATALPLPAGEVEK